MHHNSEFENLEDDKALHRERKKRLRMRVRGKALKRYSARSVMHIVKVKKKK